MKKKDLKNGMIVETRDKHRLLVLGNKIMSRNKYDLLTSYKSNLVNKFNEEFDIIKVYKIKNLCLLNDVFKDKYLSIIWERKEDTKEKKREYSWKLSKNAKNILKKIPKKYKWLAKDVDTSEIYVYENKPTIRTDGCCEYWDVDDGEVSEFTMFKDYFKNISPYISLYIDNFVDR